MKTCRNSFCHSRVGGNPVVMILALFFLFGMVFAPAQSAFAIWCIGDDGIPKEIDNDTCPDDLLDMGGPDFRDDTGAGGTIGTFISQIKALLNTIVPFHVGIAVFTVIWGIFGYISNSAEEEKRAEARQFILWGVIFIFFMLSIWGLVNILNNSFNLKKTPIAVPSVFPTTN